MDDAILTISISLDVKINCNTKFSIEAGLPN